jgi:methylated-DNA-protein-cysteine methyltransferase related protein
MLHSEFRERVVKVILLIPYGKVMSYGQVAVYMGVPRAARQVGRTMRGLEDKVNLPWWRVVNNAGRITIKGNLYNDQVLQRKLLRAEGIPVSDDFTFDIEKYRFYPSDKLLKEMKLDNEYIKMLHEKYFPT